MKKILALAIIALPFVTHAQWATSAGNHAYNNNASGLVGIGTQTPAGLWGEKLHIYGSGGNTGLRVERASGAFGSFLAYSSSVIIGSGSNHDLHLMTNGVSRLYVKPSGNVGIGNDAPQALLHIGLNTIGYGRVTRMILEPPFHSTQDWQFAVNDNSTTSTLSIGYGATDAFSIDSNGAIGMGTTTPGSFKLAVNGKIWTKEVVVALANPGPDYVFDPAYELPSLGSIKNYINTNRHLPEVPSAKEMEANGVAVGDMNMMLLKKVEELTLYMIQANERIEKLEAELKDLKK